MTAGPQQANVHDRRWRRAIITVAALAAAWLLGQLRTPGWSPGFYDPGTLALGLAPIISGFVLVELAALAVPAWDALRHAGPAARAKLAVAAHAVAAALAIVQAYAVARYATDVGALRDAAAPRAAAIATLAVGPFLLAALARWVDARGLTNGFALLVAWTAGAELVGGYSSALSLPGMPFSPASLALPVLVLAATVWLFGWALRSPARPRGASAPAIPMPACGITPLSVPAAALLLPATLSGSWPALRPLAEALRPGSNASSAAEAVLALALVAVLGVLFNRSGAVARAWNALPAVPAGADLVALARAARRRAIGRSALLVAAVLAVPLVVRVWSVVWVSGQRAVVAAVVVVAVALDVAREWRARRAGAFAAVWPLHRALEAEPVVARLAAAGIPAFVRGSAFRALYQFFAPYAPVVVFVPPERAEDANAILRRAFASERGGAAAGDQIGGRARSP